MTIPEFELIQKIDQKIDNLAIEVALLKEDRRVRDTKAKVVLSILVAVVTAGAIKFLKFS